jgi:hypothetical protein
MSQKTEFLRYDFVSSVTKVRTRAELAMAFQWSSWFKRQYFWLSFWRCLVRFSVRTPIILMLLVKLLQQMSWQGLRLRYNRFFLHCLQFIAHCSSWPIDSGSDNLSVSHRATNSPQLSVLWLTAGPGQNWEWREVCWALFTDWTFTVTQLGTVGLTTVTSAWLQGVPKRYGPVTFLLACHN